MSEEQKPEETEFYSEHDIIAAACNAISAVDSYDPITAVGKQRKNRIIRRSILLIDECIASLYEMFHEKKEGDEEDDED
jgi:hypothetical protein